MKVVKMADQDTRTTEPEPPLDQGEMEPLLGRPGDASQPSGGIMVHNLVLGMPNFLKTFVPSHMEEEQAFTNLKQHFA
jgi:hypothetical protein